MRDSPRSIRDNMLLRFLEWQAIETTEEFVRTGKALDVHDLIHDEQWDVYQRGMRSLARLSAPEVAVRTPCLGNPLTMLDVGGGHGAYSAAFCRRYPQLKATILDLPQAVDAATPLVAEEDLEERIVHKAGNALTEDLGRAAWDIILVSIWCIISAMPKIVPFLNELRMRFDRTALSSFSMYCGNHLGRSAVRQGLYSIFILRSPASLAPFRRSRSLAGLPQPS